MEFKSIKDFKDNFAKIYHENVAPQLKYIDNERIVTQKKAKLYSTISFSTGAVAAVTGFFLQTELAIWIGVGVCVLAFVIYSSMQKNFENKLKTQIMPLFMQAFGNFKWSTNEVIPTFEIKDSAIFERFSNRDVDDNFTGIYRGMPIEISETELYYYVSTRNGRQRRDVFKGVLISIGVGKNFTGHTIVRLREFLFNNKVYEEVKLEDPEFGKKYFVDSNDQVEARYLLTTAFMERFKNISTAFGASAECSFKNGKILIALTTYKDLFRLGRLNTPVTDTAPYMQFLKEIISIFEMIDHLKLLEKTGL